MNCFFILIFIIILNIFLYTNILLKIDYFYLNLSSDYTKLRVDETDKKIKNKNDFKSIEKWNRSNSVYEYYKKLLMKKNINNIYKPNEKIKY